MYPNSTDYWLRKMSKLQGNGQVNGGWLTLNWTRKNLVGNIYCECMYVREYGICSFYKNGIFIDTWILYYYLMVLYQNCLNYLQEMAAGGGDQFSLYVFFGNLKILSDIAGSILKFHTNVPWDNYSALSKKKTRSPWNCAHSPNMFIIHGILFVPL